MARPNDPADPRRIARRAAGRALSERGLSGTPRRPGVHVTGSGDQAAPRIGGGIGRQPDAPLAGDPERTTLRVALGADHGGYPLKGDLIAWVRELGMLPLDLGTHGEAAVDYPDFAQAVAEAVREGRADFGVCVDGAGIGSAMAANKVPGVRAANCWDVASASNAREHNFANVLCLGGPRLAPSLALDILRTFLTTPTGAERHARRVDKITRIESRYSARPTR